MSITNEQYTEAARIVAERDLQNIERALEIVNEVATCMDATSTAVTEFRETLPTTGQVAMSGQRSALESALTQVTSYRDQFSYTKGLLENARGQLRAELHINDSNSI